MNFYKFKLPSNNREILECAYQKVFQTNEEFRFDYRYDMNDLIFGRYVLEKRPFYRLYPGALEPLLRMNLCKWQEFSELKTQCFSIELPTNPENAVVIDSVTFASMIMNIFDDVYSITLQDINGNIYSPIFLEKKDEFASLVHTPTYMQVALNLCLGIVAIGTNQDLVRRIVLNRDSKKYELTHDEKYVEKAIRNGVNGYAVGEQVPTVEELKNMAKVSGKKSPHIRAAHLSLYWTGAKRTIPKINMINTIFVNAEEISKLPQGYYDSENLENME